MNKRQKFILGLVILGTVGTGLWLYSYYEQLGERAYNARKTELANYIQERAADLIRPEDFAAADSPESRQAFQLFFDAIQTPELFRIKIFDREPKIIWSNLDEIIGQDASTNAEVRVALEGGTVTLKFKSSKPEQISERQFREFTETYVPIQNAAGENVGVIEVYQTAFRIEEAVWDEFRKMAAIVLVIALIGYSAAALALRVRFYPRKERKFAARL